MFQLNDNMQKKKKKIAGWLTWLYTQ